VRIALDIDGTLADFARGFQFYCETWVNEWQCDLSDYNLGLTEEDFRYHYNNFVLDDGLQTLVPYAGAVSWCQKVGSVHQLTYVTRRRPEEGADQVKAQTEAWLAHYRFPQRQNLIFTQDKPSVAGRFDVFVEDYLRDARKINLVTPCFLIDRPWNQGSYARRVRTLEEVVR
jgi:hypothetical protein